MLISPSPGYFMGTAIVLSAGLFCPTTVLGGMPSGRDVGILSGAVSQQSSSEGEKATSDEEKNPYAFNVRLMVLRPSLSFNIQQIENVNDPTKIGQRTFDSQQYYAQTLNAIGVEFSWEGFGGAVYRQVGNRSGKVTQTYEDYIFGGSFERFGFDVFRQQYRGAIRMLTERECQPDPNSTQSCPKVVNVDTRTDAPNTLMANQGFNVFGSVISRNFSFANAFAFSDLHVRQGFAIPVLLGYMDTNLESDEPIIDAKYAASFKQSQDIDAVRSLSLTTATGFAGSVTMKSFFVTGMILVGPGYSSTTYRTSIHSEVVDQYNVKCDMRLFAGLNLRRFYTGLKFFLDGKQESFGDMNLTAQSMATSAFVAWRL